MSKRGVGYLVTVSNEEIEGLKNILNIGASLINRMFHENCRKAAAEGKLCAEFPKEYFEWKDSLHKTQKLLSNLNLTFN